MHGMKPKKLKETRKVRTSATGSPDVNPTRAAFTVSVAPRRGAPESSSHEMIEMT